MATGAESGERPEPSPAPAPAPRGRALPLALVAVATLLAFLAIFALWANRQLLDTDNWAEASSELLERDSVREQIAAFLVDELYANVDVEGQLEAVLPPRAQALAGPAAGGLRELAERGADALLQTSAAQQLWETANRAAHAQLVEVLEGGGQLVSTTGGDVVLDLGTLVNRTAGRVGVDSSPGDRLPEKAGQITILRSDQLELAQDVTQSLKTVAFVLTALSLLAFALAVWLARGWRREALRAVGIGFVVAGVGALIARSLAGDAVVNSLATTAAVEPAVSDTWSIATSLLVAAATAAIAYGLAIVLAAWLAGPTRPAVAARRALAPYLREPRFAYGGLAVIVVFLVAWGPTEALRRPLGVLILAAVLAVGVESLRRQTAREHPGVRSTQGQAPG